MKDEMPTPYPVWPTMGFNEWLAQAEKCFNCGKKLTERELADGMKCCVDCFME
jgi:hypothetical protein